MKPLKALKDSLCGDKRKYVDLRITYPSVYEVYNQVSSRGIDYKRFTQSDITYDLHLIIRSALPKTSLVEFVSEFISNSDLSEITIERIGKEHLYFYDKRYLERHFIILKKGEDTTADKVLRLLKKNNNFFT